MPNLTIRGEFPGPVAEAFYRSNAYFTGIMGPLGSGKTNTAVLKILRLISEQEPNAEGIRPTRLLAIRNTYPDLETTTIRDWIAMTGHIAPMRWAHPPTQLLRFKCQDGSIAECDVIFIALDREDHVKKLRGTQASMVWLNELKEIPRAVMDMATRPLGRYPSAALGGVRCTNKCMVGDFNAPDEDHWTAEMMGEDVEGYEWYRQPCAVYERGGEWWVNSDAENIENLPENYYEDLLKNKRREWIRVNLENLFGSSIDGKHVYDEFNPHIHVQEFDVTPDVDILTGSDFGLTPASVLAQLVDGQLRIFDEVVTSNMSASQLADAMSTRRAQSWTDLRYGQGWGDPAGSERGQADKNTCFHVLQAKGFSIYGAPSNDFILRRDAVANRLTKLTTKGEPALVIHPRCTVLKKGMSGHYQYRRLKVAGDERYHDVPDKTMYSHVCEALQYLCLGLGDGIEITNPVYSKPIPQGPLKNRRGTSRANFR